MGIWDNPKIKRLYRFEAEVIRLVGYNVLAKFPPGLRDGMWCNAHMSMSNPEAGASRFVTDVVKRHHSYLFDLVDIRPV